MKRRDVGCSSVSGPSILNNSVEILLLVYLNLSPVDVVVDVLEVEGGDSALEKRLRMFYLLQD